MMHSILQYLYSFHQYSLSTNLPCTKHCARCWSEHSLGFFQEFTARDLIIVYTALFHQPKGRVKQNNIYYLYLQ